MRQPASSRGTHTGGKRRQSERQGADGSAGGERLRKIVFAAALLALSYVAWRRVRSGARPSDGEDAPADAVDRGEGRSVPIDGPTDDRGTGDGPDEAASAVDPSLEEVDERVEADVEETPAEPGEVIVSEDVAEEAGEGSTEDEPGGDLDEETVETSEEESLDASEDEALDASEDEATDTSEEGTDES